MFDTLFSETVFDHNFTQTEREFLDIHDFDVISYFLNTNYQKRLADLHFLFLIRKDIHNRSRIVNLIKQLDKVDRIEIFDYDSLVCGK